MSVKSTRDAQKYKTKNFFYQLLFNKKIMFYPLFIMETFRGYPGLTGLFIASIMSGSLR